MEPVKYDVAHRKQTDLSIGSDLRKAFAEVLLMPDLGYWKSALLAKEFEEEQKRQLCGADPVQSGNAKKAPRNGGISLKRKQSIPKTTKFQYPAYPRAFEMDKNEDDEEVCYTKKEPEIKNESGIFGARFPEFNGNDLYDASDTESRLECTRAKKHRISTSTNRSTQPAILKKRVGYVGPSF